MSSVLWQDSELSSPVDPHFTDVKTEVEAKEANPGLPVASISSRKPS